MTFPFRYLVRFGPKQTTHVFTDLLVIGGGIAGLRAALAAPPDMQVLVVTKDRLNAVRFGDGRALEAAVRAWTRLVDTREGTFTTGAQSLYRDVLAPVVDVLPAQVTSLIIVPESSTCIASESPGSSASRRNSAGWPKIENS